MIITTGNSLITLTEEELEHLTREIRETVALVASSKKTKAVFTIVSLWNIHKKKRDKINKTIFI